TSALDKHGREPVLAVAKQSDADFFAFEIRDPCDTRMRYEVPSHFFSLVHNGLERRAFDRRAQTTPSSAAIINIAAHQCRDARRTANNNSFVVQTFVFKKAFSIRREDR